MAIRKGKAVGLVWYCKTERGWLRFPVVMGGNNRIKRGFVIVDGEERHYPDGRFQIRKYEDRKVVYKNVDGDSSTDAVNAKDKEASLVAAKVAANAAGAKLTEEPSRIYLRKRALEFEQDALDRNALEAAEVKRLVTDEFIKTTGLTFADEVRREHVLAFHKTLRQRGCGDRTISNKHARLKSFLRFCGLNTNDEKMMPPAPKYLKKRPTVYAKADNAAILAVADDYMRLAINLALKVGLREQELSHLEWGDIHWEDSILRVSSKPHWGFAVKDSEERDVPISRDLLEVLRAWRTKHPNATLVLPTSNGKPNTKLLRQLKRLAKRAGLNCGVCKGCKGKHNECQRWTLHKFRRSFCTGLLRAGVDIETVRTYAGHADLETTMRYLAPATSKETQATINEIGW
jgi:integrase